MNKNKNDLQNISKDLEQVGWCVGDAHPENFGTYYLNQNKSLFSHNDQDDSGPMPLILDILRFLTSIKIYNNQIDTNVILKSYLKGINNEFLSTPKAIETMLAKSINLNTQIPNDKIQNGKLIRDSNAVELTSEEIEMIKNFISTSIKNSKLIDVYLIKKESGGSFDLKRFELLVSENNEFRYYELKQLTIPAIYPFLTKPYIDQHNRIDSTLDYDLDFQDHFEYKVVNLENDTFLLRPKNAGNLSINLDKFSLSDLIDILEFESYTLGKIHRRSFINYQHSINLSNNSVQILADLASRYSEFFNNKYIELIK